MPDLNDQQQYDPSKPGSEEGDQGGDKEGGSQEGGDNEGGGQEGGGRDDDKGGGHKDLSEHPTGAGALWTRSEHPLIRKALVLLGIKPENGLMIDPSKDEIKKIISELRKKKKEYILLNDRRIHPNQIYFYADNRGRIFAEPTAKFADGFKPDSTIFAANPLLHYMSDKYGHSYLVASDKIKWSTYDPLQIGASDIAAHTTQLIDLPEELKEHQQLEHSDQVGVWYLRRKAMQSEFKPTQFLSGGMPFNLQTFIEVLGPNNLLVKYMAGTLFEDSINTPGKEHGILDSGQLLMPLVVAPVPQQYAEPSEPPYEIIYYEREPEPEPKKPKAAPLGTFLSPKLVEPSRSYKPKIVRQVKPEPMQKQKIVETLKQEEPVISALAPVVISLPELPPSPSEVVKPPTVTQSTEPAKEETVPPEEYTVLVDMQQVSKAFKQANADVFNNMYSAIQTRNLLRELRSIYGYENVSGDDHLPDDPEEPIVLRIREGKHQPFIAELTISRAFMADRDKKRKVGERLTDKYVLKLNPIENPQQTAVKKEDQAAAINRITEIAAKTRNAMLQPNSASKGRPRSKSVM